MKIASFEQREWINPKTDRRPMTDDWVLVTVEEDGHRFVTIDRYCVDTWFGVENDDQIVAWMPVPDPCENIF